jgi:hypothetical protein
MIYEYDILYSTGYKPDLTAVNEQAKEGWELLEIIQAKFKESENQWGYVMRKKAPGPEPLSS